MNENYQVFYLDGIRGWVPTNLGYFGHSEEAREASRNWLEGYAQQNKGYSPPVSVRPVHKPETPAP